MGNKKKEPINLSIRSTENASEFGRAGKGSRLICTALHKQLKDIKDGTQHSRLVSKLTEVIQSDPLHGRGKRTIATGDISLLEGFDFCIKKQLLRTLHIQPSVEINRKEGFCMVQFPSFVPFDEVSFKGNITHVQIIAAAVELDFEKERHVTHTMSSDALALKEAASFTLQPKVPYGSTLPIVVVIGIRLLQVINGEPYEMKEGGKLALQIVKAESFTLSSNHMIPPSFRKQNRTSQVAVKAVVPTKATGQAKNSRKQAKGKKKKSSPI